MFFNEFNDDRKELARIMLGYDDTQKELHEKFEKLISEYLEKLGPVRVDEVVKATFLSSDYALDRWVEHMIEDNDDDDDDEEEVAVEGNKTIN